MSILPVTLPPPRDWQVFEDFCRDLAEAEWGHATLHGRSGQEQKGVDVYSLTEAGYIGVQCKQKEIGKGLTLREIDKEVKRARGFEPPLLRLILATTAPGDEKAQAREREITKRHRQETPPRFPVEIKFWRDLVAMLGKHKDLSIRWRRLLGTGPGLQISTSRLPALRGAELIGREDELAELDRAWKNPKIHAISLIAVGGAGKTALVEHWLQKLEREAWRGAEAVFVWSFYSQGTGEDRQASADLFISKTLQFFGDPDPESGSPRDRGVRLAHLVRERRSLLVLDGLEPIQHPPSDGKAGFVKDPGVAALVRELAASQPGLLVLTSREEVADLEPKKETSAPMVDLRKLSKEAGGHLLFRLGVKGPTAELEEVAEEVRGHALTLTLLGRYLADAHEGNVRAWHDIPVLEKEKELGEDHAARVTAAYADWFGEGPERQLLCLLGLFDRPAEAAALAVLKKPPAIPELTDHLVELPQRRWNLTVKRLRKARLVLEELGREKATDAHPLVREHFGRVLEAESPEAYRAGHERLYEHYAAAAPDLPDTLEQMELLYRAIGHGCRAGRRQEVFDKVYVARVLREGEGYSVHKLGAFGADLTALASFFERTWDHPAGELRPGVRAWLLNTAAFCLRALGRLGEAVEPMAAGLELSIQQEEWQNAAAQAGNLSELTLTLGQVSRSVEVARESVELAERSGDAFMRMGNRTTLADALHAAGELAEAEAAFRQAEALQAKRQPEYPKLYSLQGYRYCDLLLTRAAPLDGSELDRAATEAAGEEARGLCEEVLGRGKRLYEPGDPILGKALQHLSLGRAQMGQALATRGNSSEAAVELDRAVQGLRESGYEYYLPNGLLARAALHRFTGDAKAARADLAEALEIAERGRMRLHECDAHLEWGRLCWAGRDREGARGHLEAARRLVAETGYRRREGAVAELAEALDGAPATGGSPSPPGLG